MWVLLGIVSLICFFSYRVWRKYYWAWGWEGNDGDSILNSRRYKTRHQTHKSAHWFYYAVTCQPSFYFKIKRETRWDRWAKKIRLSLEHQFNDPEFDGALYVTSNDPGFVEELAQVKELRNVIKMMFDDKDLRSITCEGRHLWVEIKFNDGRPLEPYTNGKVLKNKVSALHAISDSLGLIVEQHGNKIRDKYFWRAVILVSLSSALLTLAITEFFRLAYLERGDVMIDDAGLLRLSIVVAIVAIFLLLLIGVAWLRGSSHAHIVMLEILISGGIGLLGSSYSLLRDVNLNWDNAVSIPHVATVTSKWKGYRRKYGTYYKIEFDESKDKEIPHSFEVDFSTYSKAHKGAPMIILVKPGYLGYRWVEAINLPDRDIKYKDMGPE